MTLNHKQRLMPPPRASHRQPTKSLVLLPQPHEAIDAASEE